MAKSVSMGGMSSEIKKMRAEIRKQTRAMMRLLAAETLATAKGIFGHYQTGAVNWPKLANYTLNDFVRNQKLAEYGRSGDSPLLVTGGLRDSVESSYGWNWAAAGSKSPIMVIQEFGGPNSMNGAADIPPRPVFEPTAYIMYDRLPKIVNQEFRTVFKNSGSDVYVISGASSGSNPSGGSNLSGDSGDSGEMEEF